MQLFWKLYLWSLGFALLLVVLVVARESSVEAKRRTRQVRDDQRVHAIIAASQVEAGYHERVWPFEMLRAVSQEEDFLFWRVADSEGQVVLRHRPLEAEGETAVPVLPGDWAGAEPVLLAGPDPYTEAWVVPMRMQTGARPWTFWLGFSTQGVTERVRRQIVTNILLAVGFAAFLVPMVLVATRRTLRPLRLLTHAAEALKRGQTDVSLPRPTHDEVGHLVEAFDAMARSIRARDTEIQEKVEALRQVRDELELRVAERTENLRTVNQELEREIAERRRAEDALRVANQQLEQLATTDALTGLWNRRRFLEILESETERMRRFGTPLALVMADVDHFKGINDTYGHAFGDMVLKEVGKTLQRGARGADVVARYGGDEFLILMPGTSAQEAFSAAERIRGQLARRTISDGRRSLQVTLSVGISSAHGEAGRSPADLVRLADEALYAAKEAGRDCVRTWDQICREHSEEMKTAGTAVAELERRVLQLSQQSREMLVRSIRSLVRALEARDAHSKGHSENVRRYAVAIAETMGLETGQVDVIRRAAAIHDIGKIGVPDAILRKAGPLTPEERRTMQEHVRIGVHILEQLRSLDREIPLVRHHHERWDGKGYPDAISGPAIPIGARVLAVADAFDAITSDRVYHSRRTVAEALQVLIEESGHQFDPEVVDALLKWVRQAGRQGADGEMHASDLLAAVTPAGAS